MSDKIIRPCIMCGSERHKPVFTYGYDFMTGVRGTPLGYMKDIGWTDGVTSTVVKCADCGCNYIRDVFPAWERGRKPPTAEMMDKYYTFRRFRGYDEEAWLVRNMVFFATERQKREIRFLDYGAGSGTACNAARLFGVRDVVAYDPYSGYREGEYAKFNFPGITFTREKEDLYRLAPLDVIICKGVLEHVVDPRGELKTIYDLMSERGGYLYINNPVMDLDRDIASLSCAKSIKKSDRISAYHPGHLNYLTPGQFTKMLREAGFRITPKLFSPPTPLELGLSRGYLFRDLKAVVMAAFCRLGLTYRRNSFIVVKGSKEN